MKIRKYYLISLILTGVLLISACSKSKTSETTKETDAIPVRVEPVALSNIESTVRYLGNVEAWNEVMVFAKIPNEVTSINADVNDYVIKDQILATVKNVEIRQSVIQAEAGYTSAKAQYDNVLTEFMRIEKLFREKAVSKSQYDQLQAQKEAMEAGVQQAKAMVATAREQLSYSEIKAPISGIISQRSFDIGDVASPSMPIFTIVDMMQVKIKVDLIEKHIPNVKVGNLAYISVSGYPDEVFEGTVSKIYPTLDPMTRTAKAEVVIANDDLKLKSGMYATVNIVTQSAKNTIVIPEHAVIEKTMQKYLGGEVSNTTTEVLKYVYIVENDVAFRKQIQTGITTQNLVEVLSGIQLNDKLVTVGQHNLSDSTIVRIVTEG